MKYNNKDVMLSMLTVDNYRLKFYGKVVVLLHSLKILSLDADEFSTLCFHDFTHGERTPITH